MTILFKCITIYLLLSFLSVAFATNGIDDSESSVLISTYDEKDKESRLSEAPTLYEELNSEDVPEELQLLHEHAIEMGEITPESTQEALGQLKPFLFDGMFFDLDHTRFVNLRKLVLKTMFVGHSKAFNKTINEILAKLKLPNDLDLIVKVSPDAAPKIRIFWKEKTLVMSYGVIGFARNKDELAAMLAIQIERTHLRLNSQDHLGKGTKLDIDKLVSVRDVEPTQQEYMRADLRAVDRLIKAGYNPRAIYDLHRRSSKLFTAPIEQRFFRWFYYGWERASQAFIGSAPPFEIRMSAAKAYVAFREAQEDLFDQLTTRNKYSLSMKWLHYRAFLYQFRSTSLAYKRLSNIGHTAFGLFSVYVSWKAFIIMLEKMTENNLKEAEVNSNEEYKEIRNNVIKETLQPVTDKIKEVTPGMYDTAESVYSELSNILGSSKEFIFEHSGNPLYWVAGGAVFLIYLATKSYILNVKNNLAASPHKNSGLNLLKLGVKKSVELLKWIQTTDGELKDDYLLRLLKLNLKYLSRIEDFYLRWSAANTHTVISGLLVSRLKAQYQINKLLKMIISYSKELSGVPKQEFYEKIKAELNNLPSFVYERRSTRKLLLKFLNIDESNHSIDFFSLENNEEDKFEYKLKITFLARDKYKELDASAQAHLINELRKEGMVDSSRILFARTYKTVLPFVFSEENTSDELATELSYTLDFLKLTRTYKDIGFWRRRRVERRIRNQESLNPVGRNYRLGITSLSDNVATARPHWVSFRYWKNRSAHSSFTKYIAAEFTTVRELSAYVNENLISHNVIMEGFSADFKNALIKNNDLVQDIEDIESLIENDFYWSKAGALQQATPLEETLLPLLEDMKSKYPNTWSYEPSHSEKIHTIIINKYHDLGLWQDSWDWQYELWRTLITRGVTSVTDAIFSDLYKKSSETQRVDLEEFTLKYGAVWEPQIKGMIARNQLARLNSFKNLLSASINDDRTNLIKLVINDLKELLPERGYYYSQILEEISIKINTSESESKTIESAKSIDDQTDKDKDISMRVLSDIVQNVLDWRKKNQYHFLQFLRGHQAANKKIDNAFPTIGAERIRRIFTVLPVYQKTAIMDMLIDSPSGLMPKGKVTKGYGKKIIEDLLKGKDEGMQNVSRDILHSFFAATEKLGYKEMGTYILSYILSLPSEQNKSAGHVLKNVLEVMGLTGVKLAQFLAASELLSPEDTVILRGSQEKAKEPTRDEMYEDIEEIFSGNKRPFRILGSKGSASIKYTMEAIDEQTGKSVILKIFKKGAFTMARQQFKLLTLMAEYLVKKKGPEYAVALSIVKASIEAVKKELSSKDEVEKSNIARLKVYKGLSTEDVEVSVPTDIYVDKRLIAAEYAVGTSIYSEEVPVEVRAMVAQRILEIESKILFGGGEVVDFINGDTSPEKRIIFEPDRHAGNYRISFKEINGRYVARINIIDFGQLDTITVADRDFICELFAQAEILKVIGVNNYIVNRISDYFKMSEEQKTKFQKSLNVYFPNEDFSPTRAYFSLLSAIDRSGVELKNSFYDFIRAILQLKPYEALVNDGFDSKVSEIFKNKIEEVGLEVQKKMKTGMTRQEKLVAGWKLMRSGHLTFFDFIKQLYSELKGDDVGSSNLSITEEEPVDKTEGDVVENSEVDDLESVEPEKDVACRKVI